MELEFWEADRAAAATGSTRYLGATFNPQGGCAQPARPRARTRPCGAQGGREAIPVQPRAGARAGASRLARADTRAALRAERVLIATDGYTDDLWPDLRQSAVPIYSAIIATAPLPWDLSASILPNRPVVYETGKITTYYRRDAAGRLLMGGRGPQRNATNRQDYRHLVSYAENLWPAFTRVEWTHWWNGQFALMPDFLPRFHHPKPGFIYFSDTAAEVSHSPRRLGPSSPRCSRALPPKALRCPSRRCAGYPLHRFWRLGVNTRVAYGRLLDGFGR